MFLKQVTPLFPKGKSFSLIFHFEQSKWLWDAKSSFTFFLTSKNKGTTFKDCKVFESLVIALLTQGRWNWIWFLIPIIGIFNNQNQKSMNAINWVPYQNCTWDGTKGSIKSTNHHTKIGCHFQKLQLENTWFFQCSICISY